MMIRNVLIDEQWKRIEPLLSGKPSDCGVTGRNNRLSLEAVLWVCRTGAPWRDLPEALGSWHNVCTHVIIDGLKRAVGKRYSRPYQRPTTLNI